MDDILSRHREIAADITREIKILPHFEKYLKVGFYPFYREAYALYGQRIIEAVNKTLESDWPAVAEVSVSPIRKTKKLLMELNQSLLQNQRRLQNLKRVWNLNR